MQATYMKLMVIDPTATLPPPIT